MVRQPLREIGRVALRAALQPAAGGKLDSHHLEPATELVVRRSTAPPGRLAAFGHPEPDESDDQHKCLESQTLTGQDV